MRTIPVVLHTTMQGMPRRSSERKNISSFWYWRMKTSFLLENFSQSHVLVHVLRYRGDMEGDVLSFFHWTHLFPVLEMTRPGMNR